MGLSAGLDRELVARLGDFAVRIANYTPDAFRSAGPRSCRTHRCAARRHTRGRGAGGAEADADRRQRGRATAGALRQRHGPRPEVAKTIKRTTTLRVAKAGTYTFTVRQVKIRTGRKRVKSGSLILPTQAKVRVKVKAGKTTKVKLRYGTIINANVKGLSFAGVKFTGDPLSPTTLTLPAKSGRQGGRDPDRAPDGEAARRHLPPRDEGAPLGQAARRHAQGSPPPGGLPAAGHLVQAQVHAGQGRDRHGGDFGLRSAHREPRDLELPLHGLARRLLRQDQPEPQSRRGRRDPLPDDVGHPDPGFPTGRCR